MLFSTTALYPEGNRADLPQDSCSESTASLRRVKLMGFLLLCCWEQYVADGFFHLPLVSVGSAVLFMNAKPINSPEFSCYHKFSLPKVSIWYFSDLGSFLTKIQHCLIPL